MAVLFLRFHGFFFVSFIASLQKDREKSNLSPPSKCCCRRDRQVLHRNSDSSFSITPSVNRADAITNPSSMALKAIRIPIRWWAPAAHLTHKQHKWASTSRYWFKSILYRAFLLLLLFNINPVYSAPITYILPGTNHVLIQEASLNLSQQRNIVRTVIENTVCPHPSAPSLPVENGSPTNFCSREEKCNSTLGNSTTGNSAIGNSAIGNSAIGNSAIGNFSIGNSAIGNSATSNPATDIRQTLHSFIADTNSIEICLDAGAKSVMVNDNRKPNNRCRNWDLQYLPTIRQWNS